MVLFHLVLLIASIILSSTKPLIEFTNGGSSTTTKSIRSSKQPLKESVRDLIAEWAPMVYLSPGEKFLPLSVVDYLSHVKSTAGNSKHSFLVTKQPIDELLNNKSSFLYGRSPERVPIYVDVTLCGDSDDEEEEDVNDVQTMLTSSTWWLDDSYERDSRKFRYSAGKRGGGDLIVTYWLFYPYNLGKSVCTASSPLGPLPIPTLAGTCLGTSRLYGNHLADWEHVTLYFKKRRYPSMLYASAHHFGAYYKYDTARKEFSYKGTHHKSVLPTDRLGKMATAMLSGAVSLRKASQESLPVDQIKQTSFPSFPSTISMYNGTNHPVLFAAYGSHGLWADRGEHKYVKVPRLYDRSGYGMGWKTWESIELIDGSQSWLSYRGRWGNPSMDCDPAGAIVDSLCRYSRGPRGIRDPERGGNHFTCRSRRRTASRVTSTASTLATAIANLVT